jgi:uncharacterized delta-60 repeat protein
VADAGFYDVVLTDDTGSVTSAASRLVVAPVGGYANSLWLDTSFTPRIEVDGRVNSVVSLPDGRYYVAGDFLRVGGGRRTNLARFLADGSLDTGFAGVDRGIAGPVNAIALQSDGKIVIGGEFTQVGGVRRNRIARLNSDGSLDTAFDPSYGCDGSVTGVAVDPSGRVLVCGSFEYCAGWPRKRIARLNRDGSMDLSFFPWFPGSPEAGSISSGVAFDGRVNCIALQTDGKIVLGGWFGAYNKVTRNHVARLNPDGTLDAGFNPSTDIAFIVNSVALQLDGKVVLGGGMGALAAAIWPDSTAMGRWIRGLVSAQARMGMCLVLWYSRMGIS